MSTPPTDAGSMLSPVTACPICGGGTFSTLGERSDGMPVLQCERCRMGFLAKLPTDPSAFYTDDYYAGSGASGIGYTDYGHVATHSLAWTIELIRLLRPEGRILDVGCADGHLLRSLGPPYEAYGIEVNEPLLRHCEALGIQMLGQDICDRSLGRSFSGFFHVITAIATLEHVADMRAAVEQMRDLLTPDGVLVFETPLISATHDNSAWFRSSLEHIYYPTPEGLDYLFRDVFALPLIGREVPIRNYASTFVGLATRSADKHRQLAGWFHNLLDVPVSSLDTPEERLFRLYFDLVHAASPTLENVALLTELPVERLTKPLLHRLAELWQTDLARAESLQRALEQGEDVALGEVNRQARSRGAALEAALEQERSRAALEAALERERSGLAALEAAVEERRLQICALEAAQQERDSRLAAVETSLSEREAFIEKLLASTSWKLTAPVRAVGRFIRRLRHPSPQGPSPAS